MSVTLKYYYKDGSLVIFVYGYKLKGMTFRLRDVLNRTPGCRWLGLCFFGRYEYVNKAFRDLFGYTWTSIPNIVKRWYSSLSSKPQYYQDVLIELGSRHAKKKRCRACIKGTMAALQDRSLKQVKRDFFFSGRLSGSLGTQFDVTGLLDC